MLSDEEDDTYPDDLYDVYSGKQSMYDSRRRNESRSRQPAYIEEEEEDDYYDQDSFIDEEFEMVRPQPPRREPTRQNSRRPQESIRKIRVKVHAEDTRYVMIGPAVEFADFVDQIRQKFGMKRSFKIKIRDDEDMITMADQDDLDMALQNAKAAARREKLDMGKMEVSISYLYSEEAATPR